MVEKITKPLFGRPWVKYFFAPLAAGFILWVIDRALPNLNLLREIGTGFVWVHHLNIPGTIFLLIVIAAAVLGFRVGKLRRPFVEARDLGTEEMKPETPSLTSIAARGQRTEEVKPDVLALAEEQHLVLVALAGGKDSWTDGPLFELYTKYFPKKVRLHFNLVIDDLQRSKLIDVTHNYSGETYYTVLPKGRDVVREILKRMPAEQPQDAATEPNLPLKKE
jgi:hypothetical protein